MKYLITFTFLAFFFVAHSQVEIRPFIGMNFSNVSDSPDGTSTQAKIGSQIGASLMIGNRFHLNPGIAYFSRSTEYSSSGNVNVDQTVEGVTIPILVGYRFVDPTTEPFLNFRAFAGPSLMFLTTTKYDNGEINDAVDWNDSQWGAQVGAGLDVSIFFVDVTYEFGLTNTNDGLKEQDGIFDNFTEFKQNTFIVNAGVRLSFSK
ncbi:porin family protein [Cryomorphaceae bacterium 1068]|nr:porin family protein [Cryomorphaceae bacterium 1068]